jgi:hypothetical protein
MLPSSFSTQRDFINALGEHLRSLHKPFAGADFRVAFIRENGLRFLTGSVEFQDHHTRARGEVDCHPPSDSVLSLSPFRLVSSRSRSSEERNKPETAEREKT